MRIKRINLKDLSEKIISVNDLLNDLSPAHYDLETIARNVIFDLCKGEIYKGNMYAYKLVEDIKITQVKLFADSDIRSLEQQINDFIKELKDLKDPEYHINHISVIPVSYGAYTKCVATIEYSN